ncbi:MAG: flagellar biosynthesis protein FlhB [Bacillota bacterium]
MADQPMGEKTEEPTPKRIEKAREEGQVAKSQEFNAAFTLLASFLVLFYLFGDIMDSIKLKMIESLKLSSVPNITPGDGYYLVMDHIIFIARLVSPMMIASALIGAIVSFLQVGPMFNVSIIQPKFEKLDPIKGAKNILSIKSLVELVKSMAKAIVITFIAYWQISNRWENLISLSHQGLEPGLLYLGDLIFQIAIRVLIFLIILGIFDLIYQRWDHHKKLMMTKQEVKEERKEMEGDPQLKSKRRQIQREMSVNRMMSAMEEADVVITNPTHIAVALKYELDEMDAPEVIAKGEGYIAEKIKNKADELGIIQVENKSLARALNATTEIGQKIPGDLYQAVAEVLAFVYKENEKYSNK